MALVTLPRQLIVDANGTPRVGAKLYAYEAGTVNPIVTYTTRSYDVPHAHPVLSVSDGLFPAINVNPDVNETYKLVVTDADGVTIYTDDDIEARVDAIPMTQDEIGAALYPRTQAEIDAGVTPVNYAYPSTDLRRFGLVGDGSTDDTAALANAALIGGSWEVPAGVQVKITNTITITKAVKFYSQAPVSPNPPLAPTQAYFFHDFSGTFFDLVGSASSDKVGAGVIFDGISLVQNHGDGSGASGICIRNVALSDTQKCPWLRMENFQIETVSGKNDWTGGILLDGVANTSGGNQNRDIFLSRGRIVGGAHSSYAIKSNGAQNIFIDNVEASLTNADLILTGDASHVSASVFLSNTTFNKVSLDYATNVYGAGNTASQFISTANTADVALGISLGVSQTLLGTRVTIYGESAAGKFQVASSNNVRYEIGGNSFECTGPVEIGTNPATSGAIRLANATKIVGRNAANSANVELIGIGGNDRVQIAPAGAQVEFGFGGVIYGGAGTPEGVVTAPVGSLFLRSDGSTSTTLYVKTSGTGNTGWTAK